MSTDSARYGVASGSTSSRTSETTEAELREGTETTLPPEPEEAIPETDRYGTGKPRRIILKARILDDDEG